MSPGSDPVNLFLLLFEISVADLETFHILISEILPSHGVLWILALPVK